MSTLAWWSPIASARWFVRPNVEFYATILRAEALDAVCNHRRENVWRADRSILRADRKEGSEILSLEPMTIVRFAKVDRGPYWDNTGGIHPALTEVIVALYVV